MNYYRAVSTKEFETLLSKGFIKPLYDDYISLSQYRNEAESESDSEYKLVFDADELLKQGAIIVEYNKKFMSKNPDIFEHIMRSADDDMSFKDFSSEAEVVIQKIILKDGVLVGFMALNDDNKVEQKIKDLLIKTNKKFNKIINQYKNI